MRAQTTLDFAIGISLFLVVVVYALAFVPGMLQPFVESQEENTIISDRAADKLSQELLGSPDQPFVLNETCTVAFFNDTNPGGCRFDASDSLTDRLGVTGSPAGTGPNVQVEITGDISASDGVDTLCWDDNDERLVEEDNADCGDHANDTVFVAGGDPPTDRDGVVVSRRIVSINDTMATVFVRVW